MLVAADKHLQEDRMIMDGEDEQPGQHPSRDAAKECQYQILKDDLVK